jgi:hypothetical protein
MINPPKTIDEARARLYGSIWDILSAYNENYCAFEMPLTKLQCSRKNGHGINGLYCKKHAVIVDKLPTELEAK